MASVVFMRGVNVGGHRTFRPAALAKKMSAYDVVNVGAAGTFVVRKAVSQASLRADLGRRLPVDAELMICPARDVEDLLSADPWPRDASRGDVRRYVSVLAKKPGALPKLPLSHPPGTSWQVKIVDVRGKFALSLWRRMGKSPVYPNEIVEKKLGVSATTRGWETMERIQRAILSG